MPPPEVVPVLTPEDEARLRRIDEETEPGPRLDDHAAAGEAPSVDNEPDVTPPAHLTATGADWLIDAADLLAQPDPGPTPWLVQDLIVDQAIVAAVGRWKTTKSYALLDLCISIATGRPAFGRLAIPNPGPVVFVNEESGKTALWRRLDALCRGRAIDPEELRGCLHLAANARVRLDDLEWHKDVLDACKTIRPRLICFDPLARMKSATRKENEQSDMAVLIDFVRHLRDETEAAVLFVHHTGHAGEHMRGASDLETAWETRLAWKREGQSPQVTIESEHREAEAGDPIRYRIAWDHDTRTMRFELLENNALPPLADRIVAYLTDHPKSKADDVAKGLQVRASDVRRTLDELATASRIEKGESGRLDKVGRPIRDTVYSLPGGSSQTLFSDTPGTSHGTSHDAPSQPRTSHTEDTAQTKAASGTVPRPDTGTNQDEPPTGHRAPVPRPPLFRGGTSGTSHPPDGSDFGAPNTPRARGGGS